MNTNNTITSNKMSEITSTLIAFGIMGVIIAIGILYGMELDKIAF